MKQVIRNKTFETNSSSMHSLTIVTQEEFNSIYNSEMLYVGETWLDGIEKDWASKEEITSTKEYLEFIKDRADVDCTDEDVWDDFCDKKDIATYDEYMEEYEHFKKSFTTPSGDKMVAFGYFGYDG